MKYFVKSLSVIMAAVMLSSVLFAAASAPSGADVEGFSEAGLKDGSCVTVDKNDNQNGLAQSGKQPISKGCQVECDILKYDTASDSYIEIDKNVQNKHIFTLCDGNCNPIEVAYAETFNYNKEKHTLNQNGETAVDFIVTLDDVKLLNGVIIKAYQEHPELIVGWYSVYASVNKQDIKKPQSKILEFKNRDNYSRQSFLISSPNDYYAKYVMLRVYYPVSFKSIATTFQSEYDPHLRLGEFAIFGKPHTHKDVTQTKYAAPTCLKAGSKTEHCPVCNADIVTAIAKLSHKTTTTTTAATYFAAGKKVTKCTACGTVTKTETIAKKVLKTPTPKLTAVKKALKVKVGKATGQNGFQIRYRLKGKSKWTVKTYTGKKTATKTLKLKAKKNYQVQVRAMVKSGSKKAYSSWSKTYTKKTK